MQLMPDKFAVGDDPFDPPTNLLRAGQLIKALQDRWGLPELVAAAYFGAIDPDGRVTGASDGHVTGYQYVEFFRSAYARYKAGLVALPQWLASPFGDRSLSSEMITFGFLGEYGAALATAIRGSQGVGQYGTAHLGLDLQIPGLPAGGRGAPVVAPFDGRIVRTADPVGGPFGIWLESEALNLRARLMHMDGLVVGIETGRQVKAGQQLGLLGAQGTEEFPHLHLAFERLSDGQRINPALFYRLKDPTDPTTHDGRWFDGLPSAAPSVPVRHLVDARLIPDGDAHAGTWPRLRISRWGPFELSGP
jgi:murein DD-endopeptidase MepM/ murein hydrolase activator NlpD